MHGEIKGKEDVSLSFRGKARAKGGWKERRNRPLREEPTAS
jgi:hypothetical protein